MFKVGDKVWVNTDGPEYLWGWNDLIVYELLEDGRVEIGKEEDRNRSERHFCRLRPECLTKQKSPD